MPYDLHVDLSYCLVDGQPVFLDLRRDRYFRLTKAMEHAFLGHAGVRCTTGVELGGLIARGILVAVEGRTRHLGPASAQAPARSTLELPSTATSARPSAMLEVGYTTLSTRLRLKRLTLKQHLEALASYRDEHAQRHTSSAPRDDVERLLCAASAIFLAARIYVPIDTCCLPDSIALIRFLARRGLHADLVFGVMTNPLSAHCWVQAGDLVLNDTVGNASAHTPIRVI